MEGLFRSNNEVDQTLYTTARLLMPIYRRRAYSKSLQPEQRALHRSESFGAFYAERIIGCPGIWWRWYEDNDQTR